MKRKILISLAVFAVGVALALGGAIYALFGGLKGVEDGAAFGTTTAILDVPFVPLYLVDAGGGKFVLVDGGVDQNFEAVRRVLASRGAEPEDILAVVLTHGHSDHVGAAYGLTDKPLYVHELDVAITQGDAVGEAPLNRLTGALPRGLTVTHPFKDGDVLEFGTAKIEVFHAPGHSAGNSALLVNDTLLLGDTAQVTEGDELVGPPDIFTADPEQAIASIRALGRTIEARAVQPKWLVGGHSGGTQRIEALTKYQTQRANDE